MKERKKERGGREKAYKNVKDENTRTHKSERKGKLR